MNTTTNVAIAAAPKTETKVDMMAAWNKQFGTWAEFLKKHDSVKSKAFRALSAAGLETKDISKYSGVRYQHVRNVLITPVGQKASAPKTEAKVEAPKTETVKVADKAAAKK